MNLMMLLEMAASGFGDREAFRNEGASLSYAELFRAAGTAARETARAMAGMGHRITVLTTAFTGLAPDETADGVRLRIARRA